MKRTYLEFEKPVETLEAKIESLKNYETNWGVDSRNTQKHLYFTFTP